MQVTKDSIIADIVSSKPDSLEIFMDYGLHCFSCNASSYETLGEGAAAHNIDEDIVNQIIEDLNAI